jgi:HAD superfamily hydrolase (TIGR01549 family)
MYEDIDAVIFDLDGTIAKLHVDWELMKLDIKRYLHSNYNVVKAPKNLNEDLDDTLEKLGKEAESGVNRIIEEHELRNMEEVEAIKDTITLIKKFKDNGKKLVVFSTNMRRTVETVLSNLGLDKYFDFIVAREDVKRHKPNPEGLSKIINHLRVSKSRVLYIGNDWKDTKVGKSIGVKVIKID